MKVERKDLYSAMLEACSVVEKRPTRPILSNVLFETDETDSNYLHIQATDLERSILLQVSAEDTATLEPFTVDADRLKRALSKIKEGLIDISTEANQVILQSGRQVFKLATLPAEEFPELPDFDETKGFRYDSRLLAELIDTTLPMCATDETRYYLGGVYTQIPKDNDCLRMVSTDGHRLAYAESLPHESESGLTLPDGVIIPRLCLGSLLKILGKKPEGWVDIAFSAKVKREGDLLWSPGSISFSYGMTTLYSLLIEGSFPDYKQVLPKGEEGHVTVDSSELAEAVDSVIIVSQENSSGLRLVVGEEEGRSTIMLTAQSAGVGGASCGVNAGEDSKGCLESGFNGQYLLGPLKVIKDGDARLSFTDGLSPMVITPVEGEEPPMVKKKFLVMPMRI